MKKIIFLLLVVPFFGYGQKGYTVDRITGFKSILLGNNKTDYENNLKFIRNYGKYSVFNYVNEIELFKYKTSSKQSVNSIALKNNISVKDLMSYNSSLVVKRGKIKKNIEIVIPRRKPIIQELLYFFGKKVKGIRLTFDNSTSRLTTIFLDFSEKYNVNHLLILPSKLEKLYKDISIEIGPASSPKNINSASFYPLSIKGEIVWIGNDIVLKVMTGSEYKLNLDGTSYLMKNESISFISKGAWNN